MTRFKNIHFSFILFFIFTIFLGCKNNNNNRLYLTEFEYSISGKDGPFFQIEDDLQLQKLSSLVPNREGYIWLRSYFELPEQLNEEKLAIYLGITKIAECCYINGNYVGKSGEMPPKEFSSGEVPTYFSIPPSTLNYDGAQNLLELNFWINSQGRMDSNPFIGTFNDVYDTYLIKCFSDSKVSLIVSYIMIVVAFIYFILYIFRPKEKANLSFSRLNFCSSLYMLTMCIGEYSHFTYAKFTTYLLYLKLFTGIGGLVTTYFAVSFIRDYFGRVDSLKRKIYRISITIIPCIIILLPKTIHYFYIYLGFAYLLLTIHIFYAARIIFIEFKNKNKKIYTLLLGFSPVLIALILDIIFMIIGYPFIKLFVVLGWQLTILTFLAILIFSFAKTSNEVEYLNNNLEVIVKDRTIELEKANKLLEESNTHLEYERERAQTEIDLAAFVQQSFYNNYIPELDDWDIGFYCKASSGVSGDLYDFFIEENKLDGFGIFDVSGHGIASGLVTMLVKNIIHQEFYEAKKYKLEEVLDIINYRVIEEKGSIENYLTGILARIKSNDEIEFVNAGHPLPIMYSKNYNIATALTSSAKQFGVIGIQDFPINFKSQEIKVYSGDSLLLYTDGITEAENSNHEEYGLERLSQIFAKTQNLDINNQINSILEDVYSFTNSNVLNDDITILIIRKK